MGSDGDDPAGVGREDRVERELAAVVLRGVGLGGNAVPDLVVLAEVGVDDEVRVGGCNVSAVGAAVAGVNRNALAEELAHGGAEGVVGRQGEVAVGVVGGLKAASQGRDVVALW